MIRGLVGLSFLYSAAGFTGPISTRPRPAGSSRSSCGISFGSSVTRQAPQPLKAWRSIKTNQCVTCMTADDGDTAQQVPASAAPRLKRVRRRRKDGASVAIAKEEEEVPPPAAADFESAKVAAAAAARVVAPPPPPVAAQQPALGAEEEEEGPLLTGGTKGTKVGDS